MTTAKQPSPESYRYERKFIFASYEEESLHLLLKLHPIGFNEAFPPRHVNNVYFDTQAGSYYQDNIDGTADRLKCRVRWYGDLLGEIARPILEFKIKRGLVGSKTLIALPAFHWDGSETQRTMRQVFRTANLPGEVELFLKSVEPTVVNRYRRCYFASPDKAFRLTVDTGLEFFPPERKTSLAVRESSEDMIVELKYDASRAQEADSISQYLESRISRNSKYVHGFEAFH